MASLLGTGEDFSEHGVDVLISFSGCVCCLMALLIGRGLGVLASLTECFLCACYVSSCCVNSLLASTCGVEGEEGKDWWEV